MGDFSFSELIIVGIIAIVIWGKDLPHVARKMAKWYNKLRRQLTDIKDEISRQIPDEEIESFKKKLETDAMVDESTPPSAPTGLMAESTEEQVYLSWDPADRATTYTVKRSREAEEPHVTIASDLPDTSYADDDIVQGDVYYYVITGSNAAGESEKSEEAMVTIPKPGGGYAAPVGGNGSRKKKKPGKTTRRGKSSRRKTTPSSRKGKSKK